MIYARFCLDEKSPFMGFEVTGHADWADRGEDVVCASVSSAVQLVCNTITDHFGVDADVRVSDGEICLYLPEGVKQEDPSSKLLDSFCTHLRYISDDYPGTIKVSVVRQLKTR